MPETIVLTINVDVAAGPKFKETRTLSIDAYDNALGDGADAQVQILVGRDATP